VRAHPDTLQLRTRGAWVEADIDLEPELADRRRFARDLRVV